MQAMRLNNSGEPLVFTNLPDPQPAAGEVRVRVAACGVCRTDLHVVDGELPNPKLPVVPGHEIGGRVDALGAGVDGLPIGARVGIPWLGWTCGRCRYCREGRENLCDAPQFTGYTRDGGYATHVVADALSSKEPWLDAAIDWDATLAYRRHLWSWGFGIAEAPA